MKSEANNQKLTGWMRLADDHWREFHPEMYEGLRKSGQLRSALKKAEESAEEMYDRLRGEGLGAEEATEISLREFILLPVEDEPEAFEQEEGEANLEAATDMWLRYQTESAPQASGPTQPTPLATTD